MNINCGLVLRVVGFVWVVGLFVEIVVFCNWLLVLGFVNCRIIIMTSEGDKVGIDLKAFVKAVQGEFKRLNARFDHLSSPSKPKSS